MLDSRTKETIESDIKYFKEQQKNPTDKSVWGVPATFQEVERALKDSTTTPDERELLKSWILEFSYLNNRITDNTAKERLEKLKKDISVSTIGTQPPAPVEDKGIPVSGNILTQEQITIEKTKFREVMKDFSPEGIENGIRWTEGVINSLPSVISKNTIRWAYGAFVLLDMFRQNGLHVRIEWVDTIIVEPLGSDSAKKMQEKLQTLIRTNVLSLDTIKLWLLYSSPTFTEYVPLNKTQDGKIDPKASVDDYQAYAKKSPRNPLNLADVALEKSLGSMRNMNFPQVIADYKNLWLAEKLVRENPDLIKNALAGTSLIVPPVTPPVTPPVWSWNQISPWNTKDGIGGKVGGKAGEFFGEVGSNVGGLISGASDAINAASREGWALGGIAVALVLIIWGWKLLNKEWDLGPLGKHSGWMWALIGLWGKSAYDMAQKYGLIDKTKQAAEDAANKARWITAWASSWWDSAKPAPLTETKKPTEITVPENLTPSEKSGVDKIMNSPVKKELLEKDANYPATPTEYLEFLTKTLKDTPLATLTSRNNPPYSIFSWTGKLDPSIKLPNSIDPLILKRIARIYITGEDVPNATLQDPKNTTAQTKYSIDQVEKKYNIQPADTLSGAISKIYNQWSVEASKSSEALTEAQVIEKIKKYEIMSDKVRLDKFLTKEIQKQSDGSYTLSQSVIDMPWLFTAMRTLDPKFSIFTVSPLKTVSPFIFRFDKNGDLLDQSFSIDVELNASAMNPMQQTLVETTGGYTRKVECAMKQNGAQIHCIKK